MGIVNINALKNNDVNVAQRRMEAHIRSLADAHRRGEHTFGNMRRDCPLCR